MSTTYKKPKLSELEKVAVEARRAGMTYGQYVAMQYAKRDIEHKTEREE